MRTAILALLLLCLGSSCRKEFLEEETLMGTWNYTEVDWVSYDTTLVFPLSGQFIFKPSDRQILAGGTLYGEALMAEATLPKNVGTENAPAYVADVHTVYFTSDNYNLSVNDRSIYNAIIGWEISGGLIDYTPITLQMKEDGDIRVMLRGVYFNLKKA